jgi:hypothetical protein
MAFARGIRPMYVEYRSNGEQIAFEKHCCNLHVTVFRSQRCGKGYQSDEHKAQNVYPEEPLVNSFDEMELAVMDNPEYG